MIVGMKRSILVLLIASSSFATIKACWYGQGSDCTPSPCRCEASFCQPHSRICIENPCATSYPGSRLWTANGCGSERGNVALGRMAFQSGNRFSVPEIAVDGKIYRPCTNVTADKTGFVWWYVDLQVVHLVEWVVLFGNVGEMFKDAIYVGNNTGDLTSNRKCSAREQLSEAIVNITCEPDTVGRIMAVIGKTFATLTLCEVLVIGRLPDGEYLASASSLSRKPDTSIFNKSKLGDRQETRYTWDAAVGWESIGKTPTKPVYQTSSMTTTKITVSQTSTKETETHRAFITKIVGIPVAGALLIVLMIMVGYIMCRIWNIQGTIANLVFAKPRERIPEEEFFVELDTFNSYGLPVHTRSSEYAKIHETARNYKHVIVGDVERPLTQAAPHLVDEILDRSFRDNPHTSLPASHVVQTSETIPMKRINETIACEVHNHSSVLQNSGLAEGLPVCTKSSSAYSPCHSIAIKVKDLKSYIDSSVSKDSFQGEFQSIPNSSFLPQLVGNTADNKAKNRFPNITAYDHNRVVLKVEVPGDETDYINASYISGYNGKGDAYIAAQAPKTNTTRDMWRLVWQCTINTIVNINSVDNKTNCNLYWPEVVGTCSRYGMYTVRTLSRECFPEYNLNILHVMKGKNTRTIRQLQFTQWPDKSVPEQPYPFLSFIKKVRSFDSDRTGPLLIHCRAGVGRTGTFIALDCLIEQAKAEDQVDVFGLVNQLRRERVMMVQTEAQYRFVYNALYDATICEDTAIPCADLRDTLNLLHTWDANGKTKLEEQFKILTRIKPKIERVGLEALWDENVDKNRNEEIVPDDIDRLKLHAMIESEGTYVNAVYVDSYRSRRAMIVTQLPLPNTVNDFWRLVYQQRSTTIVLLNHVKFLSTYWPDENYCQRQIFGRVLVENLRKFTTGPILTREFRVRNVDEDSLEPLVVRHFEICDWPDTSELPSKRSLLSLIDMMNTWLRDRIAGRTIVQCTDGSVRCGLFCAATYILEKMTVDQEVDVFLAIRYVSNRRPQFVNSLVQYRFLHEFAFYVITRPDTCVKTV